MERQIFWTNLRQEGIRRQLKRLERLEQELGRITIETRPTLWRYNHQKRERFEEGPGHIEARKAWTDALPASFQSFRLPQSDIEGGETGVGMLQWGYAMEADMAPGTGLDALPLSEYLPPYECVRTVICISNEVFLAQILSSRYKVSARSCVYFWMGTASAEVWRGSQTTGRGFALL